MSDILLRAIARDAGIQISAAVTTGLVERARQIHNTTPVATAALGRTLTATAIMGSQLKVDDGSVTVQVKGNGPLGAIVCVGDADGFVRGYLQNPSADLPLRPDGKLAVGAGVGRGYLMVIKDIGLKDPVTGTVALVNGEIAEDLTRYFAESEQVPSACALGVLVDTDCTVKCAGGWLVQLMPGVKDTDIDRLEANLAKLEPMTTMLDKGMTLEQIVQAVLDGFAVDFLQTDEIGYRCACSREKVERALISMGRDELSKMAQEQETSEVTCQFCDKIYTFTRAELEQLLAHAEK
ncbi:MAG: Hsp33 family molecular chaperone HslO [Clostridiaceae bacterium]|nr:Hsp33 family molecular chaperone HslO [uncultured Agathobaculum sp.]MBS6641919.1 Hsp33 family molecular chaperone HslO [Clostridiaceae bacterium]HIX10809.1 Hsp33 family molecular chaperone HslO [Candidatus Agathobaculum pullistercoris]